MRTADRTHMAWDAITRYPLRMAMMLLATGIGVAAVVLLTSLGEGARRFVSEEFSSLGTDLLIVIPGRSETSGGGMAIMSGATPRDLTLGDAEAVAKSPYVSQIAPVVVGAVPASASGLEREVPVMGSTASLLEVRNWTVSQGSFLPSGDLDDAIPVAVIGTKVVTELFPDRAPIGAWLRLGDRRFRVIGILESQGRTIGIDSEELVIIPVASAQSLMNTPSLFRILVQARSRDDIPDAKSAAIDIVRERHYGEEDITVITQDAVLQTFDSIFSAFTMALGGVASVSLLVAGVLTMNVMLVAVSQRTEEVGLFKALGARRRQILMLFLTEAVILSILGAAVGVTLGFGAAALLRSLYPAIDFVPPPWAVAAGVSTAVACSIVFGLLPARRASKLDAVDALSGR